MVKRRSQNRVAVAAYNAEYQKTPAAKRSAKKWIACNRDKIRDTRARWRQSNPENVKAHLRNRRAKKEGNGGVHTAADIRDILSLQKSRCAICRIDLKEKKRHIDHIVPLARGGSNGRRNLQILCVPCNLSKSDRDPIEFMQAQGALL